MRRSLLALCLLFSVFATNAQAQDEQDSPKNNSLTFGVGVGFQYGGLFGVQGAFESERQRIRFAIGYAGISAGYDFYVIPSLSAGAQIFTNQYRIGAGLSFNYRLRNATSGDFILGLDLFRAYDTGEVAADGSLSFLDFSFDSNTGLDDVIDPEPSNGLLISLGYHF